MVRHPALAERIAAILDAGHVRKSASVGARIGVLLAAVAVLVPLSAFQNRTVYKAGVDGVTAPKVVSKIQPSYTEEAKAAKIQGTVELTAVITAAGRAEEITVTRSLDPGLDTNSILSLAQWTFEPGTKDGQPVDVSVAITSSQLRWLPRHGFESVVGTELLHQPLPRSPGSCRAG
jgi:TonB family protein